MATASTLDALLAKHFDGKLKAYSVGGMQIEVTNAPKFTDPSFTVEAKGPKTFALFGASGLSLTNSTLRLSYNGKRKPACGTITGTLAFGPVIFDLTITLAANAQDISAVTRPVKSASVAKIISSLAGGSKHLPDGLDGLTFQSASLAFANAKGAKPKTKLDIVLGGHWGLPLGMEVKPTRLSATWAGKLLSAVDLGAELDFRKGRVLTLAYDFRQTGSTIAGKLSSERNPITLPDVMQALGVPVPAEFGHSLAKPKHLDLASFEMKLDLENHTLTLSGANSAKLMATAYLFEADDETRFAFVVDTPKAWKAGDLSPVFRPLDKILGFDTAFICAATHTVEIDGTIHAPLKDHTLHLQRGICLGTLVRLRKTAKGEARVLHGLTGNLDVMLTGSLGPTPAECGLSVQLADMAIDVPGAVKPLDMRECALEFSFAPKIALHGELDFPSPKAGEVIAISGEIAVSTRGFSFSGHYHDSQPGPSGAEGLVLEDIGAMLTVSETDGVTVEMDAGVRVGTGHGRSSHDRLGLGFALPGLEPDFLYTEFEELDLAPLFAAVCRAGALPSSVKSGISFKGLKLWNCMKGTECYLSDGRCGPPGFIYETKEANIFGMIAHASVRVTPEGMSGDFSVDQPITAPGFSVSDDTNPKKGPHLAFDTSAKVVLDASCRMRALGIDLGGNIKFGKSGFTGHGHVPFMKTGTVHVDCTLSTKGGLPVGSMTTTETFKPALTYALNKTTSVTILGLSFTFNTNGRLTFTLTGKATRNGRSTKRKSITRTVTPGTLITNIRQLVSVIEKEARKSGTWT